MPHLVEWPSPYNVSARHPASSDGLGDILNTCLCQTTTQKRACDSCRRGWRERVGSGRSTIRRSRLDPCARSSVIAADWAASADAEVSAPQGSSGTRRSLRSRSRIVLRWQRGSRNCFLSRWRVPEPSSKVSASRQRTAPLCRVSCRAPPVSPAQNVDEIGAFATTD
jgi:hypothetical protein